MLRVLLVRNGCKACLEFIRIIPRINLLLPLDKQIRIINMWEREAFGLKRDLIGDRFEEEDFADYPILFLDGILISGALWSEQLKHFLDAFLKKDYITNR